MTKVNSITDRNDRKKFRIASKKLFLTFSRCDLDLSLILNYYQKLFQKKSKKIISYFLVKEFHKKENSTNDIETHIHIFLELDFIFDTRNSKSLDIYNDDICYHGNYQVVKHKKSTIKYLLKDFISFESDAFLISEDLKKYITSNGEFLDIYTLMISLGKRGLIDEALKLLESENPKEFLTSQLKYEKSLRSIYLKARGFKTKFNYDSFNISDKLKNCLNNFFIDDKSLIVLGSSGTGKTRFFQSLLNYLGKIPLVINNYDSIKEFRLGYHNIIVMDDMSFDNLSLEVIIKLLDSSDETTFDVKYGSIRIPENTLRIVISNRSFDSLFGLNKISYLDKRLEAVKRRVKIIDLGDTKLYLSDSADSNLLIADN